MFQPHGDDRGQLVALEEFKDIPFKIKRVYYMYDTGEGVRRGYHAHKNLEQILICIHGTCKILLDNGKEKKVVPLEKPYEGLYVANNMWREMFDFSSGEKNKYDHDGTDARSIVPLCPAGFGPETG